MPRIQLTKSGGVITWGAEDWLSGLHPQYSTSTAAARKLGNFLGVAQAFDPYRNFGWATPGYNPADLTNVSVVDALQLNMAVNDLYAYTVGGEKLHRITILDDTITNDTGGTGYPHTINHAHSSETATDVCVYTTNNIAGTSTTRIFYSFYDATDWDVGCTVSLAAAPNTFDDDFMSTAPATPLASPYLAGGASYPHPLKVGADDILYIGDRNFVHAYDGNGTTAADDDGKFFPAVLTLPKGYIVTGFAKIEPTSLVVFAYKVNSGGSIYLGQSTAFFWDYLSLDPYKVVDLNDNLVGAPFEINSTVGCFTQGRPVDKSITTKTGKLQLWDGSRFRPKAFFIGNVPSVGGVDIVGDQIMWNSQGSIFSYGDNLDGQSLLNSILIATGTGSGLLKSYSQVTQIGSTGTTTDGGLQKFNSNYSGNALVGSTLADPNFPIRTNGQVKRVRVKFKQACSGGRTLNVYISDEEGNNSLVLSAIGTITAGKLIYEREYKSDGTPLPVFDSLKVLLDWESGSAATDAPIVEEVEVEYENKNIALT